MKRIVFLLLMTVWSTGVFAQAPATESKPLADLLGYMIGTWEGEGVARGEHEFIGKLSVSAELENNALLVRRESMNKDGGPSGGLQELMIIGYDGTTKKIVATLYDNKNVVALYVGEPKDNEVTFSMAVNAPGYVRRRTIRFLPDGTLSFVVEGADPGKEVSKSVEINFKKKM